MSGGTMGIWPVSKASKKRCERSRVSGKHNDAL